MKNCPSCEFDISETRNRVPNSKNKKVIVCALCGYPVEEKHRNFLEKLLKIQITMLFSVTTISVLMSILVLRFPWWLIVLIGILTFVLLFILLQPLNKFFYDAKLEKSYKKMSIQDYEKLVETDDRLISKRAVTMGLKDKRERYESYQTRTEEKMKLIKFAMATADRLVKASRHKSLTKHDYDILRNHITKIYTFSNIPYNQLLAGDISNWNENSTYSNYIKEVEKFIELMSAKPRFTVSIDGANQLNEIAQELEEEFAVVEKRSKELQKLTNTRMDDYLEVSDALYKVNLAFNELFLDNIFTSEETDFCIKQEREAFDAMVEYRIHQDATKINLPIEATYEENLAFDGPIVEFVNERVAPEELLNFWTSIENLKQIIEQGKQHPANYGLSKA